MRLGPVVATPLLIVGAAFSCGDGAVATSAGGAGGAGGSVEAYTLDNYCARAAPRFCASVKPCCQEDFDYDEALCRARWTKEVCAPVVALARAGRLSFTLAALAPDEAEARLDGCFEAFGAFADRCGEADVYDYLAWLATDHALCRIFDGTVPLGDACTDGLDCAAANGPGTVGVACASGTCQAIVSYTYPAGGPCPWWSALCDEGYHCDAPLYQTGGGTCVADLPLAEACTKQADNPECGWQAHCDLTAGICVANDKVAEGPCTGDHWRECRSQACDALSDRCAHPIRWDVYPGKTVSLDGRLCGGPLVPEGPP